MRALADYVEFPVRRPTAPPHHGHARSGTGRPEPPPPGRPHPQGHDAGRGRAGDRASPEKTSERNEGTLKVVTATYSRGDQRITAEFVEGVLIRYSISSK